MRLMALVITTSAIFVAQSAYAQVNPIRLNTIGYLPDSQKLASIVGSGDSFTIIRATDHAVVYSGTVGPRALNVDTNEQLGVADFSSVREPGQYILEVKGAGTSPPFKIGSDVYDQPFRVAMMGMYLWRCGTAVSVTYDGKTFAHDACHLDDGWLDFVGGGHNHKDGTKGWHDAGDYNKYVVNGCYSAGVMLQAWEHFGARLKSVPLKLPESGNGTPDFLNEIRWELGWLLTMQMEDGRVYHKLSTQRFGGFIKPEKEKAPRFFVPWSSAATADFAAVMAMAARDYQPFDPAFAKRCLEAAKKSEAFLLAHPEDHPSDQNGFSTGPYAARDPSCRLWADVELWETTGEAQYLSDFQTRAARLGHKVDRTAGWGNVTDLAMYAYLLSTRAGRDPALVSSSRADLLAVADQVVKTSSAHGYGRPLGTAYYWGCNGDVAQQVETLEVAHRLSPRPEYRQTALSALNYLFGRNCFGRSMVTGLGYQPPLHPHDRRSGADGFAWPGYLVGGGWPHPMDWRDQQENYRVNEIAINWNATLIYALADVIDG